MKRINLFLSIVIAAAFTVCTSASAALHLPDIFSDNMVLQQKSETPIWGTASPNAEVQISCSWTKEIFKGKADANGKFRINVKTPVASKKAQSVTVSGDGTSATLNNVLIGEVWLCSGQSNMEMPIQGWPPSCPLPDYPDQVKKSIGLPIHCVMVREIAETAPVDECYGKWMAPSKENTMTFSATAFNFAYYLYKQLNIPVGILVSAWGGTSVDGWIPKEVAEKFPLIDVNRITEKNQNGGTPCVRYNGMIKPIEGYKVKGCIWYQGEHDTGNNPATYCARMKALIECWREKWNEPKMPFYMVQIAPFIYSNNDNMNVPLLREQQWDAAMGTPYSGIISTVDLVASCENHNIHPREKADVGKRLANLALYNDYNYSVPTYGPTYKSMKVDGSSVELTFNVHGSYIAMPTPATGFEVAGSDGKFYPATATVKGADKVVLTSPEVSSPQKARYCYREFQLGDVKDALGLPMFPFRTDK